MSARDQYYVIPVDPEHPNDRDAPWRQGLPHTQWAVGSFDKGCPLATFTDLHLAVATADALNRGVMLGPSSSFEPRPK